MADTFKYRGVIYDVTFGSKNFRHGGPFDRGSADSYYGRRWNPHYFIEGSYTSPMVSEEEMTEEEIQAYAAGYEYNQEVVRDFKDWG